LVTYEATAKVPLAVTLAAEEMMKITTRPDLPRFKTSKVFCVAP
jgi:hypothetical protein